MVQFFSNNYNIDYVDLELNKIYTKNLIIEACKLCLRANAKITTACSGGLDSSIIYLVIDKLIKENNTFKDISKNYIPFFLDFSESTLSEIKYISSLEENTNKKFNKVTVDSRNINHQNNFEYNISFRIFITV